MAKCFDLKLLTIPVFFMSPAVLSQIGRTVNKLKFLQMLKFQLSSSIDMESIGEEASIELVMKSRYKEIDASLLTGDYETDLWHVNPLEKVMEITSEETQR